MATSFESFGSNVFHQSPHYSQYQEDEDLDIKSMFQRLLEGQRCQNEEMEYKWSNEHQYNHSNEDMGYVEEYEYRQDSFDPNLYYHDSGVENHQEVEDLEIISMFQQLLEGQQRGDGVFEKMENNVGRAIEEMNESIVRIALHLDSLNTEGEIEEVSSDEDMVQERGIWDDVDEHQEDCAQLESFYEEEEEIIQFQEDESHEDVQDAHFPLMEEIEEIPRDEDMTLEGEVEDVFPTGYESVLEHRDDPIYIQQQSLAKGEAEESICLHKGAMDEDALASIVAVMNDRTLRLNKASIIYEKNKEDEEVVQLFELPLKELLQDEPRILGSPTQRLQHPQGLRKRLEWRIKHKWKIKPHNV